MDRIRKQRWKQQHSEESKKRVWEEECERIYNKRHAPGSKSQRLGTFRGSGQRILVHDPGITFAYLHNLALSSDSRSMLQSYIISTNSILTSTTFLSGFKYKTEMFLLNIYVLLLIQGFLGPTQTVPTTTSGDRCPPNSHFDLGQICMESCDTVTTTASCSEMGMGCFCDKGYILESDTSEKCIPASECKVTCPSNMHYDPNAAVCQPKCVTISQDLYKCPDSTEVRPQCVCNSGYILYGGCCITWASCFQRIEK
ncbi:uncharacterized protein O3C94_014605 [Discoglossus pictus]